MRRRSYPPKKAKVKALLSAMNAFYARRDSRGTELEQLADQVQAEHRSTLRSDRAKPERKP